MGIPKTVHPMSLEAFEKMWMSLPRVKRKVMAVIELADGLTCEEVEQRTGMKHQTASAAIRHLVQEDLLMDSGRKRRTTSGRRAVVWEMS